MSDTRKRVAIVFRGIGNIGGTNNTIAEHARALQGQGYAVDLIGEKVGQASVTVDMGRPVKIARLPVAKKYKWRWFAWRAQRVIAANRYHFVIGHGHHYRQDVLSMHNCLRLGHELMHASPLDDPRGRLEEIHDRIFALGDYRYCICNSRLMRDDLVRRYGLEPARMRIIYPGYRPEQFDRADRQRYRPATRQALDCGDKIVIGLVTSGDYANRGLDRLLSAYAGLDEATRRRALLLIVGKKKSLRAYLERARRLGIADAIRLAGHTREPQRYIHALDICAHPASIETFGQSVQEAIACGVPVVTSRRVGATELLPRAQYDALPASPDIAALRARLAVLIADPELRAQQARQAYQAMRTNTHARNIQATMALYREAGL